MTLITDIITKFNLKRLFKKLSSQEAKFNFFLRDNKKIFIFLPDSEEELKKSEKVFEFFFEQNSRLTVFSNVDILESFRFKDKCDVIKLDAGKLNKLNLPNDVLKKQLTADRYPVCIDLNNSHTILNVYVMGLLNSKYRIGFRESSFDDLFNLLIDKPMDAEKDQYLSMISSLKMFL